MGARLKSVYGNVPISASNLYTNATNQGASISMIQVTNNTANNRAITVRVSNDSGATFGTLAAGIVIPPATAIGLLTGTLNIGTGGIVQIYASSGVAGDCLYLISMMEYFVGS